MAYPTYRYVKLVISATNNASYAALNDVKILEYGTNANLSLNKPITLVPNNGSSAALVDDNMNTYWYENASALPITMTIDLGAPKVLGSINIASCKDGVIAWGAATWQAAPKTFKVYGSNDTVTWFELLSVGPGSYWTAVSQYVQWLLGGGALAGNVKDDTGANAVGRVVRAYRRDTGALLAESTTDAGGNFSMTMAFVGQCYIVALDDVAGTDYNALIQDRVLPA